MALKKLKKRKKYRLKNMNKYVSIAFILLSFSLLYAGGKEVWTTYRLHQQLSTVQSQLTGLMAENATLTSQKDKLMDEEYVKSYARGSYMLSKDGEQIFYLPESDTSGK